ncbi:MAG: hypothetical protein KGI71_03965 [Patescibacteria group bacterium]|nr:hypothetical protein [Patescibacteria group bacterium]
MKNQAKQIRQGDVQLQPIAKLPPGCIEIPADGNRIVLAYGEVTGHAHAIYDHLDLSSKERPGAADEIAQAAIERARSKARLWKAPSGERYLEVIAPVTLRHEEHTQHDLAPGVYHLPTQVEYTPAALRRVAD